MKKLFVLSICFLLIMPILPVQAGESWEIDDDFIEDTIQQFLDAFMDGFFYAFDGVWAALIDIIDSEILGVNAELIIFIIGCGLTISKLLTGSFFPKVGN